ncbi:uncharacterized protein VP01_1545g2, partial [Puccinia sorghi]
SQPPQYKMNIDDNTVSPQGHHKPKEAPHLLSELPDELQNFVEKIYDVRPDGHCGFRAAAFCLWGQEQAYMEIRDKLYKEPTMNSGRIFRALFLFSKQNSQTCFPHVCAPNSNNSIFIAYIKSQDHFSSLKMKNPHIFTAHRPLKKWKRCLLLMRPRHGEKEVMMCE